jgi:cupin fold WbuC family metalloprotein
MIMLKMRTTEVYDTTDTVVHFDDTMFRFLAEAIVKSPRKRSRICAHKSTQERLHEMFVIYSKETYVRPNKHFGKDESVFVLKGRADFLFFDDAGNITQVVRMGAPGSGLAYYCRVPTGIFHTILIHSDDVVLFEATPGPFDPSDTLYADWAPAENTPAVAGYVAGLLDAIAVPAGAAAAPSVRSLRVVNPQVYVATERVVPWSGADNDFLKQSLHRASLDRVRICAHHHRDDRLHEMLMAFSDATYIRPSMHIDKEESLLLLEGLGTYFFFDDHGKVVDQVALGPIHAGRSFYCRIPANTWHALVLESDLLVAKETTSGPFSRADTRFPDWCPDGTDRAAVVPYLDTLRWSLRLSA